MLGDRRSKMRTQNKENYYYMFWIVAMIAFIVPQVFTAIAYMKLADIIEEPIRVELVNEAELKVKLGL